MRLNILKFGIMLIFLLTSTLFINGLFFFGEALSQRNYKESRNSVPTVNSVSGSPIYMDGNGHDLDALAYSNVDDALNYRNNNFVFPLDASIEPTIAIIDFGLDEAVWNKLEAIYGVNIGFIYIEEICTNWFLLICIDKDFVWGFTADSFNGNVNDPNGHGNMVTSVVAQTAPTATIYMVQISSDEEVSYALDILYGDGIPMVNIISISLKFEDNTYRQSIQDKFTNLFYAGVETYIAIGNADVEVYDYPSSYDYVHAIGGIYDDLDGYMTNGDPMGYSGFRITKSKTNTMLIGNRGPWGSNWNSRLELVAPAFDWEIWWDSNSGTAQAGIVDGTSFAAPYVAAIALLLYDAYEDRNYDLKSSEYLGLVGNTLILSAEGVLLYNAVTPTIGIDFSSAWVEEYGYGAVDAYDALIYAALRFDSPPIVYITAPTSSEVSGTITITVYASDETGVRHINFFINGNYIGTDSSAPYTYSWDTTGYQTNSIIEVQAFDIDGYISYDTKSVTISAPSGGGGGCFNFCIYSIDPLET